jgi:hypothetical protein
MREILSWKRNSSFWNKTRGANRSVRRSAVVWGSAFALVTGVVGVGLSAPAAESATAASASSQTASFANGVFAGKSASYWQDAIDRWFKKSDNRWNGGSHWDRGDKTPPPVAGDDTQEPTTPPAVTPEPDVAPAPEPDVAPAPVPDVTPAPEPDVSPAPAPELEQPAQTAGWPTAATTGVPDGVSLTPMNGLTVKTDGAVIDAKLVKGDIVINANNVTIKNSKVEGRIQIRPPYTGLMVQSTEIAGPGTAAAAVTEGIGYANFTCDRCDIHGWGKGAMMDANVTISNSWIHDMPVAPGSHNEAILSLGGYNYNILNNRLDSGGAGNFTASLAFLNQWNSFKDTLVKDNLFNGGGYCVYAGGEKANNAKYPSSDVRFIDNTFGTDHNSKCGYYGAAVAWDSSGPGNEWSGNVMADGSAVRTPSAG